MISLKRLEDSLYSEPYEPYVYTNECKDCWDEGTFGNKRIAEGKEDNEFNLYVRLICPVNPQHNGDWYYHCRRPLKFRIKKTILRKLLRRD